jgi:hypothetical protein
MATLNLGRIKPVFRDAYAGGTAYVVDDIVTFGDETFICILASTGNATSNATYWKKLAAKGTDGTDLTSTLTTEGDLVFRDGSGLQRLAKGTTLQTLAMNAGATAPEWVAPSGGKTIKRHFFQTGARTAGTAAADSIQFTITSAFTPVDPTAGNNDLWVQWATPVNGGGQSWGTNGLEFRVGGAGTDYNFNDNTWHDESSSMAIRGGTYNIAAGTIPAGTYTVKVKNYALNGEPNYWNCNSSDESRVVVQMATKLMITEYKN